MPLYNYYCENCKGIKEILIPSYGLPPQCCGETMSRMPADNVMIRIKGQGLPARRKWMDNWKPGTPPLSTGSLHGARY